VEEDDGSWQKEQESCKSAVSWAKTNAGKAFAFTQELEKRCQLSEYT